MGHIITHISYPRAKFVEHLMKMGFPPEVAEMFADLDTQISQGADDRTNDAIRTITGRAPKGLTEFIEENKSIWLVP